MKKLLDCAFDTLTILKKSYERWLDLVTVSVALGKKYFSSLLSFPLLEKK